MAHASVIFFWLAFLLYGAAFAVFLYHLFGRHPALNNVGLGLVVGGLACQTAAIVLRGLSAGRLPVVGAYESLNMVAWSIVVVYLLLELFTRIKAVGLYVMPVVLVLLTVALVEYQAPRSLTPKFPQSRLARPLSATRPDLLWATAGDIKWLTSGRKRW